VRIVNFLIADLNVTARKKLRREQKLPSRKPVDPLDRGSLSARTSLLWEQKMLDRSKSRNTGKWDTVSSLSYLWPMRILVLGTTTAWSLSKILALFFFLLPPKHSSLEKLKGNGFILCLLFSFLFYTCSFLSHWIEFLKGRKNRFYFALAKSEMHPSHWALFGVQKDVPENSTEECYIQFSDSTILWLGLAQVMAVEA